jgi:ribosomal protein S18 acetylase RimI-like enzyme
MVLQVRRATKRDAPAIARVQVDTWRTTYRGIVPDSYLDNMDYARSQRNWEDLIADKIHLSTVFVAEDDKLGIIGFASCGAAREKKWGFAGELYAIYMRHEAQGQGTGRRLVLSVARELKAKGLDSMLVWVLAENPYKRFYDSIGGTCIGTNEFTLGGAQLEEIGYGWAQLDSLISRLTAY